MLTISEVKVVTFYAKKKCKKTKKETSVKCTSGIRVAFTDVAKDLEDGQEVVVESSTGTRKPYKAHGLRVFFHFKAETYSVTMPCQPKRDRACQLQYHEGKVVVLQPTKNGGGKDVRGFKLRKFQEAYSLTFVKMVLDAIASANDKTPELDESLVDS